MNYSDGTEETIPIVFGEDLRDWWNKDRSKSVSRGAVVWEGSNPAARPLDLTLRLYLTKWIAPAPSSVGHVIASYPPEVPQRYRKLGQSGLMIEVKEGQNTFDLHLASE